MARTVTSGPSGRKIDQVLKSAGIDVSRGELLVVPPEALLRITDESAPGYDARVHEPATDEDMVLLSRTTRLGTTPVLVVRRNGSNEDGSPCLEIVFGRRRHANALEINRRLAAGEPLPDGVLRERIRLPVRVVPVDDDLLAIVALAENTARPETVASRASKIRIATQHGRSVSEIAQACGMARETISAHLALFDLSTKARLAFEDCSLPIGAAVDVAKLARGEQMELVEKLREQGTTKRHHVKAAVEAKRNGEDVIEAVAGKGAKMLSRREIEAMRIVLDSEFDEEGDGEIRVIRAVFDFVLGNRDALNDAISPALIATALKPKGKREAKAKKEEI